MSREVLRRPGVLATLTPRGDEVVGYDLEAISAQLDLSSAPPQPAILLAKRDERSHRPSGAERRRLQRQRADERSSMVSSVAYQESTLGDFDFAEELARLYEEEGDEEGGEGGEGDEQSEGEHTPP